jgi:hypothetical protein
MKKYLCVLMLLTSGAYASSPVELHYKNDISTQVIILNTGREGEFYRLSSAGVRDIRLLSPYIACIVPAMTKAVVVNGGFFSSTVLVIEGSRAGCTGTLPNEWVKRN